MQTTHFVIFYVDSPIDSAAFYAKLLGKVPVDSAPTFVMFALDAGLMLGLWAKPGVLPPANPIGGSELALAVDGKTTVDAMHANWQCIGARVVQAPTEMDFGYTFVALDPDGHRLRVFAPTPVPTATTA